jgi:hypothetical protein
MYIKWNIMMLPVELGSPKVSTHSSKMSSQLWISVIPETCYDNALADAIIGAEDPAENEVETQFDLFTWNGIMQGMFISMMYYFAESTLVKMLEKTGFVMWYATDASLDPGSAYFLWGGFDFISGSYAAWGSAH